MAPLAAAAAANVSNEMFEDLTQCIPDPFADTYSECKCTPDVCDGNYLTLTCPSIDEIPKNVTDRIGCL